MHMTHNFNRGQLVVDCLLVDSIVLSDVYEFSGGRECRDCSQLCSLLAVHSSLSGPASAACQLRGPTCSCTQKLAACSLRLFGRYSLASRLELSQSSRGEVLAGLQWLVSHSKITFEQGEDSQHLSVYLTWLIT